MKVTSFWKDSKHLLPMAWLAKKVTALEDELWPILTHALSHPPADLPRRVQGQRVDVLALKILPAFRPLQQPILNQQWKKAVQSLRQIVKKLVPLIPTFDLFIILAQTLQYVLLPVLENYFPARRRSTLRETVLLFLQAILIEIMQGYMELNNRIIKEKTLESSLLFHTTQSVSTELNLDALLNKVVLHAGMLLKNRQIYLFVVEPLPAAPQDRRLYLRASNQLGQAYGEYSLGFREGPLGKVAEQQVALVDNQYYQAAKKLPLLSKAKCILAVPITFSNETLGVLLAAGEEHNMKSFNNEEKELFMIYANQIALSFKNVLLYQTQLKVAQELEEKNRMLESQADLILRQSAQMVVLNDVAQKINTSIELKEVLTILTHQAAESIGLDRCIVWLFDENKMYLNAAQAFGIKDKRIERMTLHLADIRETFLFKVFSEQKALTIYSEESRHAIQQLLQQQINIQAALVVPMVLQEETIGLLMVDDTREAHEFLDDEIALISSITNQTVMAIANARLYLKVKEQAITDGLTGLYNHRFFQLRFSEEFSHCRRYGNDLALIMIDIDHFKRYNDTYGHIAGDLALKEIANLIRVSIRENDIVARYGGEEFVIILPMTNAQGANSVAERIRLAVLECKFLGDMSQPQVTMSISAGISAYSPQVNSRETLLKQADAALYTAKQAGRNQSILYCP